MKPNDFLTRKKLDEAMPMSAMSKLGQTIASKLPTFAPQTAAQASGKLETGKIANQLMIDFKKYLGQTGQKSTKTSLLHFLNSQGYPTDKVGKSLDSTTNVSSPTKPDVASPAPSASPNATPKPELKLVPKDLELMPKESLEFRKLLNLVNEATTEPVLTDKQVANTFMLAAQEAALAKIQPKTQSTSQATSTNQQPQSKTQQASKSTAQIASEFVRATDSFIQAGGKLTPQMKQKLQQLINKS